MLRQLSYLVFAFLSRRRLRSKAAQLALRNRSRLRRDQVTQAIGAAVPAAAMSPPTWKSAIQQTRKSALRRSGLVTRCVIFAARRHAPG